MFSFRQRIGPITLRLLVSKIPGLTGHFWSELFLILPSLFNASLWWDRTLIGFAFCFFWVYANAANRIAQILFEVRHWSELASFCFPGLFHGSFCWDRMLLSLTFRIDGLFTFAARRIGRIALHLSKIYRGEIACDEGRRRSELTSPSFPSLFRGSLCWDCTRAVKIITLIISYYFYYLKSVTLSACWKCAFGMFTFWWRLRWNPLRLKEISWDESRWCHDLSRAQVFFR